MKQKSNKLLSPKLDIIFQALFGEVGNEKITKKFLEEILKEKIDNIDLSKNPILRREYKEDKLGVLDVIAKINGNQYCDIEMQVVEQADIIKRIMFYAGKMYTKQIKAGEPYGKIHRTIAILITDYDLDRIQELENGRAFISEEGESLEVLPYHTKWRLREENHPKWILTETVEIHIISIERAKKEKNLDDALLDWMYFLENPESERVRGKMEKDNVLKEAVEKLDSLSEDERMQRIAELREKAIRDEKSIRKAGVMDGEKKSKLEIAKNMKNKKMPIELIAEITGLSKEEIEKL